MKNEQRFLWISPPSGSASPEAKEHRCFQPATSALGRANPTNKVVFFVKIAAGLEKSCGADSNIYYADETSYLNPEVS